MVAVDIASALGFPKVADDPERREIAEVVREWLAALEAGTHTSDQFDAQVTGRQMFLYCCLYGPRDEYYPRLCAEIDRRKAMIGMRFCQWRGWVTVHDYDAARHDRAAERAAMPSKFSRER